MLYSSVIDPLDQVRMTPLFRGLSEEALSTLMANMRALDYSLGNIVINEGTLGDTLYIIAEGSVQVIKNLDSPNETILETLKKGEIFGEMSIIESVPRSASIRAQEEPTKVFGLHKSDLHRLFKTSPSQFALLILNISRDLCRRLRKVDELYAARAS